MPKQPDTMSLDAELFAGALTDTTLRPRGHPHLQTALVAGAAPSVHLPRFRHNRGDRSLLSLTADANVHVDSDGALLWAAKDGHLSVVQRLLAAGADIHAMDDAALRCAAAYGRLSIVECLLAAGADVHRMLSSCPPAHTPAICKTLDAWAAAIPVEQRMTLIDHFPRRFPALKSLTVATQRQSRRATRKG